MPANPQLTLIIEHLNQAIAIAPPEQYVADLLDSLIKQNFTVAEYESCDAAKQLLISLTKQNLWVSALKFAKHFHYDKNLLFTKNTNGLTALHYAAQTNHDELFALLLTLGEKYSLSNDQLLGLVNHENGQRILHMAALNPASNKILKHLVSLIPNMLTVFDYEGDTPLHTACLAKNPENIAILINADADLTYENHARKSSFDLILTLSIEEQSLIFHALDEQHKIIFLNTYKQFVLAEPNKTRIDIFLQLCRLLNLKDYLTALFEINARYPNIDLGKKISNLAVSLPKFFANINTSNLVRIEAVPTRSTFHEDNDTVLKLRRDLQTLCERYRNPNLPARRWSYCSRTLAILLPLLVVFTTLGLVCFSLHKAHIWDEREKRYEKFGGKDLADTASSYAAVYYFVAFFTGLVSTIIFCCLAALKLPELWNKQRTIPVSDYLPYLNNFKQIFLHPIRETQRVNPNELPCRHEVVDLLNDDVSVLEVEGLYSETTAAFAQLERDLMQMHKEMIDSQKPFRLRAITHPQALPVIEVQEPVDEILERMKDALQLDEENGIPLQTLTLQTR